MKILSQTTEVRTDSEDQAKNFIDGLKEQARQQGYFIKSAGYTYRKKKAQGEIVDEAWVVKYTSVYGDLWSDEDDED